MSSISPLVRDKTRWTTRRFAASRVCARFVESPIGTSFRWARCIGRFRRCFRFWRTAISRCRISLHTRRRSRTCLCRSPGDSFAMSESRIGAETERGLDANSLWQLIAVRFREYMREPEALFWSFGFPILLAIGLGIAFRSKPADLVHVAVVSNGPRGASLAEALRRDKGLSIEELAP